MTGGESVRGLHVRGESLVRLFRGRDGAEVRAVDGVTIEAVPGEWVALSGPSGCGKSTLLALLGALDAPTSGTVRHDGEEAAPSNAAAIRRRIGFAFQSAPMVERLAVWENVTQALVPAGVRAAERRRLALESLERLGIGRLADRRPEELSGGERQRAAVARALVVRPRLILADEPTSQLDADSARAVLDALRTAHAAGVTIVAASHDPLVMGAAGRVIAMDDGAVTCAPS